MKKSFRFRSGGVRIVALGGGTGLSMVLRGLKRYLARRSDDVVKRPISDLTAMVTVTDDGGSSGRLRREYKILPPGDIRNCMVALSKDEALLGRLFQYRFPTGSGLGGHSFGNLFLTAMTNVTGDFAEAVRVSAQVLAIRGRIYPSTVKNVTLEATLENEKVVKGETNISSSRTRIKEVHLVPRRAEPIPEVLQAIKGADLILVGPGSLYTSLIPNLLVRGISDAIARSRATCVYIANLMTQPGETENYSVGDHVRAIYAHTKKPIFDSVVINRTPVPGRLVRRYREERATPVDPSLEELRGMGLSYVTGDLLWKENGKVRHDQDRLTRLLMDRFVKPR